MAPEMLSNKAYSCKADIYSFALVMWQIIERKHFFEEFQFSSQVEIQVVNHNKRPPFSDKFPKELKDLISACWHPDAARRPDAAGVLDVINTFACLRCNK